ncbi:MAG TPA: FUSC family protein, partial [Ktedonobacteraceae bacterium]
MGKTFSDREERNPPAPLTRSVSRRKAWVAVLHAIWQALMRIDRSQFTLATALRSSVGVFLPLIIGVVTGHTIEGVSISAGAIGVGTIGLTYTYRARTRTMLFACLAIAFSVFVGGLIGISDWLTLLAVALWGFGAGLLVAVGPGATLVGVQATLMLILLTHFRLNPLQALVEAGLILSGALFQTMLALIPSPWLRFGSESATIATVYHALADFVQAPEDPTIARQLSESLLQVEVMVSDSSSPSRKRDVLGRLFTDAERIRMDLVVLVEIKRYLQDETGETIQQLMQEIATILHSIAKRCQNDTAAVDESAAYQHIAVIVASLRTQNKFLGEYITSRQIAAYYMTLSRHLRHAEECVRLWQDVRRHISFSWIVPRHPRLQLHDPWNVLRSNLSLHSTACRHAIRLAIVLVLATVLYRFSPLTRGYWVPITALFVLKPDFATTFNNSSTRSLGTILGAVLTS